VGSSWRRVARAGWPSLPQSIACVGHKNIQHTVPERRTLQALLSILALEKQTFVKQMVRPMSWGSPPKIAKMVIATLKSFARNMAFQLRYEIGRQWRKLVPCRAVDHQEKRAIEPERQIVELLRASGFDAHRVPLSGAVTGFESDIELRVGNKAFRIESKIRGGFGLLYRWLTGVDALIVKGDYKSPLAILPLEKLANLLQDVRNQTQIATSNPSQ
jgi:hypothetical protein